MSNIPRYDSFGKPVEFEASTASSESSSTEEYEMTPYESYKQLLCSNFGTCGSGAANAEQKVKDALSTKFPIKVMATTASNETRPPLLPLKKDVPMSTTPPTEQQQQQQQQQQKETSTDSGMPAMTKAPVDTRFTTFSATKSKGINVALPTSKLYDLTRPVVNTNSNNSDVMGLGGKHDCSSSKKGKTEPRVLAPFSNLPQPVTLTAEDRLKYQTQQTNATKSLLSLDSQRIERMTATFDMLSRIESPGMASMMQYGSAMNMACATGGCGESVEGAIGYELRNNHKEFYNLLYVNDLVNLLVYDALFVIVPSRESLAILPQSKDDATDDLLRYHLVKNNGLLLQDVEGTAQYDTLLEGKQVQVTKLENGGITINGKLLRSDVNNLKGIFHIRGILRPEDVMPVVEAAAEASPEPPDGGALKTESLLSLRTAMKLASDNKTVIKNKTLEPVIRAMQLPLYTASISLGASCEIKNVHDECYGVNITLATYNTMPLFTDYQAKCMNEVARVAPDKVVSLRFPAHSDSQTHVSYDKSSGNDNNFTEYSVDSPVAIKASQFVSGLVGVSFNSPFESLQQHTVLLCRLSASRSNGDVVLVSRDENMLMRFRDDSLCTLSINHRAFSRQHTNVTSLQGPLQAEHFIELQTENHVDSLYKTGLLSKAAFDQLLLSRVSVKKLVQKGKRVAGKATSKALRVGGKMTSGTLYQVDASVLLSGDFNAAVGAIDASAGAPETMKILTYDHAHKLRSSSQSSQLSFRKADATVGRESILVYVPDQSDNGMARDYGTNGLVKYVELTLSDRAKMSLNVSTMPANKTASVFYATSSRDILVFRFDQSSNLVALYSINKSYDLAKRLIQARKK
jgi:uncharacterized surface protein with fasciclin (FAS1) repeats